MSNESIQFLIFILFCITSLVGGYTFRRRNWIHEDYSRQIHWITVVLVWPLAMLICLWRIPPKAENLWLLAIQPILMFCTAYGMIPLARFFRFTNAQTGVMVLGAGLSNNGFTLGAYLCYSLLEPPQEALAYGLAFVSVQVASMVMLIYPLAQHYSRSSSESHPGGSILKLIVSSYFNARAAALYTALAGITLAIMNVPFPKVIDQWHIVTILFYLGAFGGYFGIGLRLRLGDSLSYSKHIMLLGGVKFVAAPLVAAMVLMLIRSTPWPLNHLAQQVTSIESFMPAGIIMVMLANLFGLDARMASVLWMWNTVMFLAIPLGVILWWF